MKSVVKKRHSNPFHLPFQHLIKKLHLLLIVLATVPLGWLGLGQLDAAPVPHVAAASNTGPAVDAPTSIESEPVQIFQRAFWARPTPADKILHAQRREWKDSDGVQKWQWFLVVEPSAALLKRLRDDNAFGLMPAAAASPPADAPAWFVFTTDKVRALKSPQSNLQLIFSIDKHTLYATDSGRGFRAGAPEPIKPAAPAPQAPAPGRLPSAHPPIPEPPSAGTTGVPPVMEDSPSRLSARETTGWKPVVHDRRDASPPALPALPTLFL
ncbi:MAG: hypothetical protein WCK77_04585 [Verrucomicrobiota bacterium]